MRELYNNVNYKKRAERAIAHGSLTNSKRPTTFVQGVYPTHIKRAYGSTVVDADENAYLDFIGGLGTNLFGYGNPEIGRSVTHAMQSGGSVFSMGSVAEVEYAEKVKGIFPFLDRVRFLKTGSEGCVAAVRIARAFTGNQMILSEGYHGWTDEFVQLTEPAHGVPQIGWAKNLSDYRMNTEVAAVIIEPVITDHSPERVKWLQNLRDDCTKNGVVLIYDETITAFRFPQYSVARYFNILPDLWIGGKAIGGGLPLSIVGGRADIMESDYFVSSTWAGDRLAIAAGTTAIDLLYNEFKIDDLWTFGTEFMEKFNAISPKVQLEGYPTRGIFKYQDDVFKALFMQEMCKAKILLGPSWFYNKFLHKQMENVISVAEAVVKKISYSQVLLQGDMPESPFAEKVRNAY